jgi:hypothetical protein
LVVGSIVAPQAIAVVLRGLCQSHYGEQQQGRRRRDSRRSIDTNFLTPLGIGAVWSGD